MSDGHDPATPPQDTGKPDSTETDPVALSSAEDLDEDRLRVDPLEEGVEPAEHWSEATRYGTTPFEQQQGESLEERVREEEPDVDHVDVPSVPERSVAANPPPDVSEGTDHVSGDAESRSPADELPEPDTPAAGRGQIADEGGSVADAIRDPESDTE